MKHSGARQQRLDVDSSQFGAFDGKPCSDNTNKKTPVSGGFLRADDGTRTHDLLHGKVNARGDPRRLPATSRVPMPVRRRAGPLEASASDAER